MSGQKKGHLGVDCSDGFSFLCMLYLTTKELDEPDRAERAEVRGKAIGVQRLRRRAERGGGGHGPTPESLAARSPINPGWTAILPYPPFGPD